MNERGAEKSSLARWTVIWIVLLAIPLTPFTIMVLSGGDPFLAWVQSVEEHSGAAAAVCFILLISDVFLPIPSSFVAVVAGQALGTVGGGLLNWVAITAGHTIGFAVARAWGKPVVEKYVGSNQLGAAERTWRNGASMAVILSRPVPVLAESLAMFAGLVGFTPAKFIALAALANLPHSFLYSWAGAGATDLAKLTPLVAAGVGIPTGAYLLFMAWARFSGRAR